MRCGVVLLTLAVGACAAKTHVPDAGLSPSQDPDRGPRNLLARFTVTGGTCPAGASGFFGIQYTATYQVGATSVEVIPCTSLTACAEPYAPCSITGPCAGYDRTMALTSRRPPRPRVRVRTAGWIPSAVAPRALSRMSTITPT